jgi:hypothetical protein
VSQPTARLSADEEALMTEVDSPQPTDNPGRDPRSGEGSPGGHTRDSPADIPLGLLTLSRCTLTFAERWRDVPRTLQPTETVDPRATSVQALLSSADAQIGAVQNHLAALDRTQRALASHQHEFHRQLDGQAAAIAAAVADLSARTKPLERTTIDALGRAVLAAALGAAFCTIFGSPVLPLALNEPILRDLIAGAIRDAVAALPDEVPDQQG